MQVNNLLFKNILKQNIKSNPNKTKKNFARNNFLCNEKNLKTYQDALCFQGRALISFGAKYSNDVLDESSLIISKSWSNFGLFRIHERKVLNQIATKFNSLAEDSKKLFNVAQETGNSYWFESFDDSSDLKYITVSEKEGKIIIKTSTNRAFADENKKNIVEGDTFIYSKNEPTAKFKIKVKGSKDVPNKMYIVDGSRITYIESYEEIDGSFKASEIWTSSLDGKARCFMLGAEVITDEDGKPSSFKAEQLFLFDPDDDSARDPYIAAFINAKGSIGDSKGNFKAEEAYFYNNHHNEIDDGFGYISTFVKNYSINNDEINGEEVFIFSLETELIHHQKQVFLKNDTIASALHVNSPEKRLDASKIIIKELMQKQ